MSIFSGAATALITPMKNNGDIDFAALEKLVKFQLNNKIDALVVNGTTGEPATLSSEERLSVAKTVIEITDKKVPVICGVGCNNTAHATEMAKEVQKIGADAILSVTPYYNKCTQSGAIAHFQAIANSTRLPIILYNVPGRTGFNLDPESVAKLSDTNNIVAIKEASGSILQIMNLVRLTKSKIDLYSGDDSLTYVILALGGCGVISVASNIIPQYMHELTKFYFSGNHSKSLEMQIKAEPLISVLFSEVNPIPVKYACKLMGIGEEFVRLPLTTFTKVKELRTVMNDFGLI